MFTGIITDIGRVRSIETAGDTRFEIETGKSTDALAVGASICCSGACMTAVEVGPRRFAIDVSAESLAHTTMGAWTVGRAINLERSLKLGDELGGHIVTGHVDGVVEIRSLRYEGDSRRLTFTMPDWLAPYIAPKGAVAIDGISLTVNEVGTDSFGVNIIPHTQEVTTLGHANVGDRINVEIDMMSRYVRRALEAAGQLPSNAA